MIKKALLRSEILLTRKRGNPNVNAHLFRGVFYLLLVSGGLGLAFFRPEATAKISKRTLTFAERVTYQRAIEDVYWRHRIWPRHGGERPDPKPSLDAVMSQAQLKKKVADYLRDSRALETYWQAPITAEQLQAEMERMAQHTKQPAVLRELFDSLGDDPFLIAECLARPVLAQRLVADFSSQDKTTRLESARTKKLISTSMPAASVNYTLPAISDEPSGCTDDTWTATSTANVPDGRYLHTAVWTGSEMIVWGGFDYVHNLYFNTGGIYNPTTDSWTATSLANAPSVRYAHRAVWTGSEMIVWGGFAGIGNYLNTGGRYNPITNSWTATSTNSAPAGRFSHTAVWTGSEMIVWGGSNASPLNTGGRYNPTTNSWTAISTTNAPPARVLPTGVWTGNEMIAWGGYDGNIDVNTGGRYNPATNSWAATSTSHAPSGRSFHTAVWTDTEMIVWGGSNGSLFNTGGRYDPITDSWTATSTNNAPSARAEHTAAWIGTQMIVWGGSELSGRTNTGARYNPGTDSWTATSINNAPVGRNDHTVIWTDSEMIVWGGTATGPTYLNTGGRYCAHTDSPTPTPTATAPLTPTATPTETATATGTPTATPTSTSRPSPTPRVAPTPRPRPTPPPRP
jgi:N-acetylneuraminic acid mutarotase